MLDLSHIPTQYPNADVQVFVGTSSGNSQRIAWTKPRGKTMGHILLVGCGGNGGNGVVGANSLAGGGGGGGSGGQTSIRFPLWAIPDTLFIILVAGGAYQNSSISIAPDATIITNNVLIQAGAGAAGGNGTTVPAGGSAGAAAGVQSSSFMPLGWQWIQQAIAGQAGAAGGTTGNGNGITLPTTGLVVTGGASGGGLGATATTGAYGGSINGAGIFPTLPSGGRGETTTQPPGSGASGYSPVANLVYNYGGTGGGSSHGSATGAGLFGGNGGNGAPGCGGGGGGACLTDGVAGVGGKGGPAFCIITCW